MRLAALTCLRRHDVELFGLEPDGVTENYVAWLNDPAVNRYLEARFVRHTLESTRRFVQAVADSDDSILFGIRYVPEGRHVGNIKLGPIDCNHRRAEIGLLIGERCLWGRGIAANAIELATRYAFDSLGLLKVTAGCYASNVGSRRAFEKAGFVVEAVRRRHFLLNGVPEDALLLARWADGVARLADSADQPPLSPVGDIRA
ncbi:MAG: GNAT family N-acetyltransferase [Burkholderiaceae bacterium]|nr:GNAT family N-acetyltransferase [Burkholderiaceae bacterium]